jgi:hypothetical protein
MRGRLSDIALRHRPRERAIQDLPEQDDSTEWSLACLRVRRR